MLLMMARGGLMLDAILMVTVAASIFMVVAMMLSALTGQMPPGWVYLITPAVGLLGGEIAARAFR